MGFERLVIAPEVSPGVNPGAGFVIYPFTSFDLGARPRSVQSQENTSNLTPAASVRVATEQGGGYNFETRLGVLNPLIEGLFLSSFSTPLSITGTINSVASGSQLTTTGNAFAPVSVGQWVKLAGLHASVNGYHLVTSKPDNNTLVVASTLTDQTGDADETLKGSMVRRGGAAWSAVEKTFAVEKQYRPGSLNSTDERYLLSLLNYVQSLRIGAVVEQLLTGTVSFLGQAETSSDSSGAGIPANPPNSQILGPVSGIPVLYEGSFAAPTTLRRSEITFEWQNNHAADRDLGSGSQGISSVSLGVPNVSATLRINMKSPSVFTFLDKADSDTRSKLAWRYEDPLGNAMMITLPNVRLEGAPKTVDSSQGTRFSTVRCVAEEDTDSASPHYLIGAQIDWFSAA